MALRGTNQEFGRPYNRRIVLESVTQDVIGIRARRRRGGRRIFYRVVDEYHEPGRAAWRCRPASSARPLTLAELIALIEGAQDPDFDEHEGTLPDRLRDMQEGADPEDVADFVRVESDFYPALSAYFEEKAREEGKPDDIFRQPKHERTQAFLKKIIAAGHRV